jgi:antirestriction protein ArdC
LASFNPKATKEPTDRKPLVERLESVEEFVFNTGVGIDFDSTKACYNRKTDKITMPDKSLFIDTDQCSATEGYYATLLHELTHWTGHPSRMNRDLGKKFGDKQYAVEELVAELGAAFLCTEFDISRPTKEQHAAYIDSWLQTLKQNKHAIFAAASEASKASEFLHQLQMN